MNLDPAPGHDPYPTKHQVGSNLTCDQRWATEIHGLGALDMRKVF